MSVWFLEVNGQVFHAGCGVVLHSRILSERCVLQASQLPHLHSLVFNHVLAGKKCEISSSETASRETFGSSISYHYGKLQCSHGRDLLAALASQKCSS
eukprot:c20615_g1_i1 orf=135-428(-)